MKIFLSMLVFSMLFACQSSDKENLDPEKDFNRVEVPDAFAISIPLYMDETKELHPDAILAYGDEKKDVFVLVFEESTGEAMARIPLMDGFEDTLDMLENYLRVNVRMAAGSLQFPEEGPSAEREINGNRAFACTLSGQLEGMELAYRFTCIRGRERIYMIMCWTSNEKKQNFEDTFTKIENSFEQLKLVKN